MDHALRVGESDRLGDVLEGGHEARQVVRRVRAVGEDGGEGPAADELHRQVRPPVGQGAEGVDGRDGRVREARGDAGLAGELGGGARVAGKVGQDGLDGDLAVEGQVARRVDDAHPPAPQLRNDFVSVHPGQRRVRIGRGG